MTPADSVSVPSPYADASQRDVANHLGMWALIATEILFFGGLFLAYLVYRISYPAAFAAGSHLLDFRSGTVNTAVLLTSSLFMAIGDTMIQQGRRRALQVSLCLTAVLGLVFLGVKFSEYHDMYRQHLIPGIRFDSDGPPQVQLFLLLYFAMTALHAVHMLIGIGLLGWLLRGNQKGRFSGAARAPVSMVGLYWHFVDCVWVFLYPLLYLIPHR